MMCVMLFFLAIVYCSKESLSNNLPVLNQIRILPDNDKEVSVKPFKIHHLLLPKSALRPETFYRLVVSFHGAVCFGLLKL